MAKRNCPTKGCPALTAGGYCTDCRRTRDRARGTRQERGYDASYDQARRDYQRRMDAGETFLCWRCLAEKGIEHHIDPRPGRWHLGHDDHDRTVIRGPECPAGNLATASRRGITPPGGTPFDPEA